MPIIPLWCVKTRDIILQKPTLYYDSYSNYKETSCS